MKPSRVLSGKLCNEGFFADLFFFFFFFLFSVSYSTAVGYGRMQ